MRIRRRPIVVALLLMALLVGVMWTWIPVTSNRVYQQGNVLVMEKRSRFPRLLALADWGFGGSGKIVSPSGESLVAQTRTRWGFLEIVEQSEFSLDLSGDDLPRKRPPGASQTFAAKLKAKEK